MAKRIQPKDLGSTIIEYVNEEKENIDGYVKTEATTCAKQALAELRLVSPREKSQTRRGYHYADGWAISTKSSVKDGYYSKKIWNPKDYRLTHLLEFGHASRSGGHVNAKPHIRDIEKKYKVQFTENLERDISK